MQNHRQAFCCRQRLDSSAHATSLVGCDDLVVNPWHHHIEGGHDVTWPCHTRRRSGDCHQPPRESSRIAQRRNLHVRSGEHLLGDVSGKMPVTAQAIRHREDRWRELLDNRRECDGIASASPNDDLTFHTQQSRAATDRIPRLADRPDPFPERSEWERAESRSRQSLLRGGYPRPSKRHNSTRTITTKSSSLVTECGPSRAPGNRVSNPAVWGDPGVYLA